MQSFGLWVLKMTKNNICEIISQKICNKKTEETFEDCQLRNKTSYSLCNGKCRISEKSLDQLSYINSFKTDNIFLKACPGSGKTEVVAIKAAYEIKKWQQIGGIAILTFTHNAANVITQRVKDFTGYSRIVYPHFVGTIDSWIHSYIAHPFSHYYTNYKGQSGDKSIRIIDSSSQSGFLKNYETKYNYNRLKIPANEYSWDFHKDKPIFNSSKTALDKNRESEFETREDWKYNDLYKTKEKFWKDGFATYQDIEYICCSMFEIEPDLPKDLSKRFPFIIIDECQDLSPIQITMLHKLLTSGSTIHFVGDINQAIYKFKKVDPISITQYIKSNEYTIMKLLNNYRSNQQIVNLSQKIIDGSSVKGFTKEILPSSCICLTYTKNNINKLPQWFEKKLVQSNLLTTESAIVARGWSTVRKMRPSGNENSLNMQEKLASSIYLWLMDNKQGIKEALIYFGDFISYKFFSKYSVNKNNYYCPEIIKQPYRWRLFLSSILNECKQDYFQISNLSNNWNKWAKEVKLNMHIILNKYKIILDLDDFEIFKQINFTALRGFANAPVTDTLKNNFKGNKSNLRITTIHQVKGETLQAIMLVSAPDKKGATQDSHWSQWLEYPNNEKARLAYVASSRPQHLLIWAVPTLTEKEKFKMENLGFVIEDL